LIGLLVTLLFAPTDAGLKAVDATEWRLRSVELFGNHRHLEADIVAQFPFKPGALVRAQDKPMRDAQCAAMSAKFAFAYAACSMVLEQPGNAFFSIDVVEPGDEWRIPKSEGAKPEAPPLDKPLVEAVHNLQAAIDSKFGTGAPPQELIAPDGFLSYSDADLASKAARLHALASRDPAGILRVLASGHLEERQDAASLLNWIGPTDAAARGAIMALGDPDPNVRNNVGRYLVKFEGSFAGPELRSLMLSAVSRQLEWPSFGDRNKALFVLSALVKASPELKASFPAAACKRIDEIGKISVVPNEGGAARELYEDACLH
jgi:hypothetical protein